MNNTTVEQGLDRLVELGSYELLIALSVIAVSISAVAWLKWPEARYYLARFLGTYDNEIISLYGEYLTPLMREKLDEVAEKHVKDEILRQVILSAFDHTEEKAKGTVKKLIRDLAKEARK